MRHAACWYSHVSSHVCVGDVEDNGYCEGSNTAARSRARWGLKRIVNKPYLGPPTARAPRGTLSIAYNAIHRAIKEEGLRADARARGGRRLT